MKMKKLFQKILKKLLKFVIKDLLSYTRIFTFKDNVNYKQLRNEVKDNKDLNQDI